MFSRRASKTVEPAPTRQPQVFGCAVPDFITYNLKPKETDEPGQSSPPTDDPVVHQDSSDMEPDALLHALLFQKPTSKNNNNKNNNITGGGARRMDTSEQQTKIKEFLANTKKSAYLRPQQVGPMAAGLSGFGETKIDEASAALKVWIPDVEMGFLEAAIDTKHPDKYGIQYTDKTGKTVTKDIKIADTQEVNPAAFHLSEDMSCLTHLNEASVLHNLRERFKLDLIHTYSGLFCVTINPWRWLPIYTPELVQLYFGQADNRPPHVYSVANTAYMNVLEGAGNQSILITGESGAGKTENTKKIIQYFTIVAGSTDHEQHGTTLEDQILEMNPVLEAFGNAKTVKNDNSSRFGKFIRIRFGPDGKVNGADVESYLLEKSRLVSQNYGERNFHIFYQLMSNGMSEATRDKLNLSFTPDDYRFTNQGDMSVVRGLDDTQEMKHTERAMRLLGFTDNETFDIYKLCAAVLNVGQIRFKQQDGCEQTFVDGYDEANAACELLGVNRSKFIDAITDPTFTVGDEVMQKFLDYKSTMFAISAVSKIIYEKIFLYIVERCNRCLNERHKQGQKDILKSDSPSMFRRGARTGDVFIGVLDISGFEILEINSFEQLCINFTNEKLQQFFNHFMFVKEQTEYEVEKIEWDHIDFGLDLEQAITLIEKPLGILSLLEEEGMVPNGSDAQFVSKLLQEHEDKTPKFSRTKISRKSSISKMSHFAIDHYAGQVPYTVDGWLDKNKDPLNDCVMDLLKQANNDLLKHLFKDVVTAAPKQKKSLLTGGTAKGKTPAKKGPPPSRKGGKSSALATTSVIYKAQLNDLIATLNTTSPHFVRCIVPNYDKTPGYLNGPLVLNQLKCNGVLEGIRICRRGYPNRLLFADFCDRYQIFDPDNYKKLVKTDPKECCRRLCDALGLTPMSEYQLGVTKIFCRVGLIGKLESRRMARIANALAGIQAYIRYWYEQLQFRRRKQELAAQKQIQKNAKIWASYRTWNWLKLAELTKTIEISDEDYEIMMAALEAASEGDGGRWQDGKWIPGKFVDGVFKESVRKKPGAKGARGAKGGAARGGGIDSEEYDLLQEENTRLKEEVKKLEEKLTNILDTSLQQEQQMEKLKGEINKQEQLVEELHVNMQLQEENIKDLTETVSIEQHHVKKLETTNQELQSDVGKVKSSLQREQSARRELEVSQGEVTDKLRKIQNDLRETEKVKERMEQTVSAKEKERRQLEAKVSEYESQQQNQVLEIKEMHNQIEILHEQLNEEKKLNKKLDRQRVDLSDDKFILEEKLAQSQQLASIQKDDLRKRESDIQKLTGQIAEAKRQYEAALNDMKGRHNKVVTQLQNDKDTKQRECMKLELENKQLRGQLEVEKAEKLERSSSMTADRGYESDYGTLRRRNGHRFMRSYTSTLDQISQSTSMNSLGTSKSSGNLLTKRVDDLERENKEIERDRRMLKRELERTTRCLGEETEEKENLAKQVRALRNEHDRLNYELMREEERTMDLERSVHKAQGDVTTWKTKYDSLLIEKQNEIDKEKEKMKVKLERANEDERSKATHLTVMEKTRAELLTELSDVNIELERAYGTIDALEKLQKTQDKALDHWGSQYRMTGQELDGLREENAALRAKIRSQQKEIDSVRGESHGVMNGRGERASILETSIRQLRTEIESSVSTSLSTLEENTSSGNSAERSTTVGGLLPPHPHKNGVMPDRSRSTSPVSTSASLPAPARRAFSSITAPTATYIKYTRSSSRSRVNRFIR